MPNLRNGRIGKSLELTPDEIRAWSKVDPSDQRAAELLWKRSVPKRFRKLLDAKSVPLEVDAQDDET